MRGALRVLLAMACLMAVAMTGMTVSHPLVAAEPEHAKPVNVPPAFDKLKTLVGTWEGKGPEGESATATFRMISAGTALLEEMSVAGMVNVYHPDGGAVMLTHYCAGNNQPRMRAKGLGPDGKTLEFDFVDVTNREGSTESHIMNSVKMVLQDADHFTQEWHASDSKEPYVVVAYTRKR